MKKEKINFSEFLRPFENQWIALSQKNDSIIASDESLKLLLEKVDKFNRNEFRIMKVPSFKAISAFLNEV